MYIMQLSKYSMQPRHYCWLAIGISYVEFLFVKHAGGGGLGAIAYALISALLALNVMLRLSDAGLSPVFALPCWLKGVTGTASFMGFDSPALQLSWSITAVVSAVVMFLLLFPRTGAYRNRDGSR
jgi:hypothetical protein